MYHHQGVPLPVVRHLTRQMLVALDYLHSQLNIIHTGERFSWQAVRWEWLVG